MKFLMLLLTGFVACSYAIQWYYDIQIPAWQALIWVLVVFIHDMFDYMESKM